MKKSLPKVQLKRDLQRLLRSLNFLSRHPALKRDTKDPITK